MRGRFADDHPGIVYDVETVAPLVALTIDDGPDPQWTQPILELLARHQAHATFFLIGSRIPGNEALVDAIVAAGHELGNHMTSDEVSVELPSQEFEAQLLAADRILSRWAEPRWLRPGSGWYDEKMVEIASRHGYRLALGSLYPLDAQIAWPRFASCFVRSGVEPGSVIVLHNGGERGRRTLETLGRILPDLGDRDYRVVTLSELVDTCLLYTSDAADE